MIADNTPFKADNNSMFCPEFKPFAASTNYKSDSCGNPFSPDMQNEFSPTVQFNTQPEFKSFARQSPISTPFTPVSPMTPLQS